jgi:hypothetical protein
MSAPPLSSWHAQRSAGDGGTRVFSREWRAHGEAVKSAADYAATIPDEPFVPLCMEPDELADWHQHNRTAAFAAKGKALSPCEDCLLGYALEMRAIGKCNGTPGAAADVEDEEPEEPAARRTMATVNVKLSAPCGSCAHEPICIRRAAIEKLDERQAVEMTPLPAGLGVTLSASIDCDAYLRVRQISEAGREAMHQSGLRRAAQLHPAEAAD